MTRLFLAALLTLPVAAEAQTVPSSFRSTGFLASDACANDMLTQPGDWIAGRRSAETRVVNVRRVCGDTEVEWEGLDVPVRWQDGQFRLYTDCRDTGSTFFCWVTVPE
ncbi:hypothetical protein HKCCE3408_05605 [Rhodobacterales bacterium HKCCE3408]|nr:hypothetical protein [Rhodobacterales bacterium HKCCE3408]